MNFVRLVIQYIYLSSKPGAIAIGIYHYRVSLTMLFLPVPQAGYDLQVFEPMNDDERFLRHMFDLFRHADIFGVQELKVALVTELRKRLDTFARVLFNKDVHSPASFKKALDCPMTAAVVAYDKSKLYWRSCEPIRSEIFCFVKDCYPVLSRLDNNDFDNYLLKAPKLILDISKQTSHIESSKFITPGPEVRCQFCGLTINNDRLPLLNSQPGFGITAGFDGRVRYFCSSSTCFRKIRIKDCFADN